MNNSEKTTIIARGIRLYAEVMNIPIMRAEQSRENELWNEWCRRYPSWVEFVKKEQHDLFDRCQRLD